MEAIINLLLEGQVIMNKQDIYEVHKAIPEAMIIVSHLEGINHYRLTRKDLKEFLDQKKVSDKVHVPEDGQLYIFNN